MIRAYRKKDPRFLLVFPPLQFSGREPVRPDGTLALPYLDAALTKAGYFSQILDMSIGTSQDRLKDTFYREVLLSNGLVRVGMTADRILEEVKDFDVIAITSIFTPQTSRCFEISNLIKQAYPDKIIIGGGVNSRSLREHFFRNHFDVIFLSEGEKSIVQFAKSLHSGTPSLSDIPGITFKQGDKVVTTPSFNVVIDLDEYPMPSWEKLPLKEYWEISRIWGGREGWIEGKDPTQYAAVFTSRGCPFRCTYCHISKEVGEETGPIGRFRYHSLPRVEQEFEKLSNLGVNYLYINDDSFLARKKRVFKILKILSRYNFKLADVNGVNIMHLFKNHQKALVVDEELFAALYEAGFRKMSLPFESGSQRIIRKYASSKLNLERYDLVVLIKKLNEYGIAVDGNFMIGYPDETMDELTSTFLLARRCMDAGLVGCQFFIVQPFPGSVLFDESIANGQLSKSWHWDTLGWSKGSSPFQHLKVDNEVLKYCWSLIWKLLNPDNRVKEFDQQVTNAVFPTDR